MRNHNWLSLCRLPHPHRRARQLRGPPFWVLAVDGDEDFGTRSGAWKNALSAASGYEIHVAMPSSTTQTPFSFRMSKKPPPPLPQQAEPAKTRALSICELNATLER